MSASIESIAALKALLRTVIDLRRAAALIEWDERVCMPAGGAETHGHMLSTLHQLAHEAFTADEVGRALERAESDLGGLDADSDEMRLVDVTERDYRKALRVPGTFVAEHSRVVSASQHAWERARAASDFPAFEPHLQRVLELKHEYVGFFPPTAHPYDHLLDDYEPGLRTTEVISLFGTLKPRQIALVEAAAERPQPDHAFLHVPYEESALLAFAERVITSFGFDWTRGRQDRSSHPFASGIGADDVRITTRFVPEQPFALLFGTMHEAGHAMYEQGVSSTLQRTPLEGGTSLGVHESQSRLWENMVGRSRAFWTHFYPSLQSSCPAQLGTVTLDEFYRAINRIVPSLIRVDADEATYNLHVMLRVELEIGLLDGTVAVQDLPDVWRSRMKDYLGISTDRDAEGVLQDIHWAAGLMGYFATYTLGNVIAAQLWHACESALPNRDVMMADGRFQPILEWLRGTIHRHGGKFEPQDLVRRATGSGIDAEPYLTYLESKFSS